MIPYYMIVNAGTLLNSAYAATYPRHLVLHDVYRQNGPYRDRLYAMKIRYNTRIILDNGAHEGIYPTLEEYLTTAMSLNPNIVVLTDIVGAPSKLSQARAMEFAKMITDRFAVMQMMYVPQGETKEEILADYEWAINTLDTNRYIIGLGQGYLKWERPEVGVIDELARLEMVQLVMSLPGARSRQFHLLGGRWKPTAAFNDWEKNIVGLDTIKPCTCALGGTFYPNRPAETVNRYSSQVANETALVQNVVALANWYNLSLGS